MSRPQYDRYSDSSHTSSPYGNQGYGGHVVNGGLIDFQDNAFRGVSEYLTPSQIVSQQQQQAHGMMTMAQPQAGPSLQMMVGNQAFLPAGLQQQQGTSASVAGGTCFSGPPSFIHVNGITYKPVEAAVPTPTPSEHASVSETSAGAAGTAVSSSNTRALTEAELHRAIDDRVSRVTKEYINRKMSRRLSQGQGGSSGQGAGPELAHARHGHGHRTTASTGAKDRTANSVNAHGGGHRKDCGGSAEQKRRGSGGVDMEEAAAQRVQAAHANMSSAARRPGVGQSRGYTLHY